MALDKTLCYAVEYWPYTMNALGDGRLELDDNLAERAIKPFVVGRKNFPFSDAPRGERLAEASAGIYSVVTTATANGLNPRRYLEWLLSEMPNAGDPDDPAYAVVLTLTRNRRGAFYRQRERIARGIFL